MSNCLRLSNCNGISLDRFFSQTLLLQAAAHAAHLAAASAPLAACAKGRHVTRAAVSEESAASAVYVLKMSPHV